MASITLRSAVGRPLTNSEVDANFSALNLELGQKLVASLNLLDLPNPAQARSNLGLGNVENKSSATIRGELTSGNVTGALGYTPLSTAGGTLSGQLLLNYAGSMVRVQDGSNVLSLGHWDGANVRIESVGRPMYLASYGGDITIGNVYGSGSLVVGGSSVSFGGNTLLNAGNYGSYALPLSGGSLTGPLVMGDTQASITTQDDYANPLIIQRSANNGKGAVVMRGSDAIGVAIEHGRSNVGAHWGTYISFLVHDDNTGDTLKSLKEKLRVQAANINALVPLLQSGNQVLHAANYGNYAISLSGATGISGYFRKNVVETSGAESGGSGVVSPTTRDIIGWKIISSIGLGNPGAGGTQFIDIRTNIASEGSMLFFKLEGYAYNYGNVNCYHGLYMYTGSLILNKFTNNLGNSVTFYDSYKDASGYLCLKINLGQTGYTSAVARLFVTSHGDEYDWVTVTSMKRSNSTAPQF